MATKHNAQNKRDEKTLQEKFEQKKMEMAAHASERKESIFKRLFKKKEGNKEEKKDVAGKAPEALGKPQKKEEAKKEEVKKEVPKNEAAAKEGAKKEDAPVPVPQAAPARKGSFLKKMFSKKPVAAAPQPGKKEEIKPPAVAAPKEGHQFDVLLKGEFLKIRQEGKKKKKKKENIYSLRGLFKAIDLARTLETAGMESMDPRSISKNLIIIDAIILFAITLYVAATAIMSGGFSLWGFIVFTLSLWIGLFFVILALLWLGYLFYLDMVIFNRTNEVEKVFPDFLQLASSNISAGMPVDRALWYAVRPNFGILAKEIESVAKNTIAGQDLSDALQDFARKYDSKIIQRSISLLLEGLAAGGELAGLLNKIALDIEETRILKRDMAANVTTYVIFITFASIVAAPALLGLSTQLLEVITRIMASMAAEGGGMASNTMFSFSFSSNPETVKNFQIFAYVMLTISSFSAAAIVSIIQKGRVKEGLSKIPVFIIVSLLIYWASNTLMGQMFAGIV